MKKRGFGAGNWNGYGGKCEEGESLTAAAVREIEEESGVKVAAADLEQVGEFDFIYEDEGHMNVHVFFVRRFDGEPQETEEMRPAWFEYDTIPYESMWEDDRHWLPRVLKGEKLRGTVWFDESGVKIKEMTWKSVSGL